MNLSAFFSSASASSFQSSLQLLQPKSESQWQWQRQIELISWCVKISFQQWRMSVVCTSIDQTFSPRIRSNPRSRRSLPTLWWLNNPFHVNISGGKSWQSRGLGRPRGRFGWDWLGLAEDCGHKALPAATTCVPDSCYTWCLSWLLALIVIICFDWSADTNFVRFSLSSLILSMILILGTFWGHDPNNHDDPDDIGTSLGPLWDYSRTTLVTLWDYSGIILSALVSERPSEVSPDIFVTWQWPEHDNNHDSSTLTNLSENFNQTSFEHSSTHTVVSLQVLKPVHILSKCVSWKLLCKLRQELL